jgi:hypothetical protein
MVHNNEAICLEEGITIFIHVENLESVRFWEGSFEVSTALLFQTEVFCVVTQCSVVVGYKRVKGSCCLHLQGAVAIWTSVATLLYSL